eukprot:1158674-Pelagomonas_calceolata.AAC.1
MLKLRHLVVLTSSLAGCYTFRSTSKPYIVCKLNATMQEGMRTYLSGFSPRSSIFNLLIFSAGSISPVPTPSRLAASTSSRITGTTAKKAEEALG